MSVFEVTSGPFDEVPWTLISIVGEEAVNQLFSFTIHALATRADLEAAARASGVEPIELSLAGQSVRFRITDAGILRYGIIAAAAILEAVDRGGVLCSRVRLEIVPRAWLLTQRRQSRIFQHRYVHQIVSQVLAESGVMHKWSLGNTYRKRVYCTQYDETDYAFVTRLLAEEGIVFFFSHEQSFTGGMTPEYGDDLSKFEKAVSTGIDIANAIGKVGVGVGEGSDNKWLQGADMLGHAGYLVADAMAIKPRDEEADDPMVLPIPGTAGPGGDGDVFAFIDQAARYPLSDASNEPDAGALSLTFGDEGGIFDRPMITELHPARRVRSGKVDLREYDFRRPMLLLEASASAEAGVTGNAPLNVYAHHGEYETPELDQELADLYLGQYRADAVTLSGKSLSPRLLPGHAFNLHNESRTHIADGRHAVTRVRHEWNAPSQARETDPRNPDARDLEPVVDGCARAIHEALHRDEPLAEASIRQIIRRAMRERSSSHLSYQNRFECVPATIAYRPPRPARAPRNVTESATVVGPIGIPSSSFTPHDPDVPAAQLSANEIYTDRFGRVKIQFHWDRDGKLNENSSCWVRVVQTWSGAGFGFQFIPRVGMEVLVTFLAGDPDRPVIIGALYNATHATPDRLPQRSTRSGIRTQSSPGGGGFNELSFEDQKGVERIYVHAQKDLDEVVNDTHSLDVKNNQKIIVNNLQETNVGRTQLVTVGGSRSVLVGENQTELVHGRRTATVERDDTTVVRGNALVSVDGALVRTVKADESVQVDGNHNLTVGGSSITQIGGSKPGVGTNAVTFVQGSSYLTATERVQIKAEQSSGDGAQSSIRLECGDSYIEIHHDKITLRAKTIEVLGDDGVKLKGKKSALSLDQDSAKVSGDHVSMASSKGSGLDLDGEHATMNAPGNATVQGKKIDLKSAKGDLLQQIKDAKLPEPPPNLHLVFTHLDPTPGNSPISNTDCRVVADDVVIEKKTGSNGELDIHVPDTAKVVHIVLFANESQLWKSQYPLGPLVWLVHLVDDMGKADTVTGARKRLRNLAYDPGTVLTDETIDEVTQSALVDFQFDRDIPVTGELDDATKKQLADSYGTGQ